MNKNGPELYIDKNTSVMSPDAFTVFKDVVGMDGKSAFSDNCVPTSIESKKHMVEWKEMKEALSSSVPLEYYVFAYCVRANNKARRRIKSTWDALSAPLELVDAPPEHRGYSRGLPDEDEDILKAVAIYRHESAEFEKIKSEFPNESAADDACRMSPQEYTEKALSGFSKTLEIISAAFPSICGLCKKYSISGAPVPVVFAVACDILNLQDFAEACAEVDVMSSEKFVLLLIIVFTSKLISPRFTDADVFFQYRIGKYLGIWLEGPGHEVLKTDISQIGGQYSKDVRQAMEQAKKQRKQALTPVNELFGENALLSSKLMVFLSSVAAATNLPIGIHSILEQSEISKETIRDAMLLSDLSSSDVSCEMNQCETLTFLLLFQGLSKAFNEQRKATDKALSLAKQAAEKPLRAAAKEIQTAENQLPEKEELERQLAQARSAISRLEEQRDALLDSLDAADKQIARQKDNIDSYINDRAELAELRTYVYEMNRGTTAEAEPVNEEKDNKTVYPYLNVPDGIICIGGYDGWRNEMQERFPTIRFLSTSVTHDIRLFRNAKAVWFQPAFISHKAFWRALDTARSYNIPVHYLSKHSVATNSQQLIAKIKEMSES